jgi:hypothetical protein
MPTGDVRRYPVDGGECQWAVHILLLNGEVHISSTKLRGFVPFSGDAEFEYVEYRSIAKAVAFLVA